MNRLTKWIAPGAALIGAASLALSAAAPASAAQWEGQRTSYGNGIGREIRQLDRQVDIAKARHQISWREAANLERKVDRLQQLYRNYSRDGFSRAELRVLDNRVDQVKRDLARQSHDRDGFARGGKEVRYEQHR